MASLTQSVSRIFFGAAVAGMLALAPAQAKMSGKDAAAVKRISQHFSGVPSMMGEFIQFGPNGEQTGGKFFLKRPGKIRFDYAKPSPILVKADGKTVAIHNRRLKTWDYAPLSKTPLRLLLSDRIDINDEAIKGVKREADLTTVYLANKSVFGNAKITLMFDPKSYELRQWTITDDQGKDTSVMIFNVQNNVKLRDRIFKINQLANTRNSNDR
ncbi:outer membrane lipoprotein carrier protein LolA [Pseudahrensia aquimaris]|uniref:Outer membrane lipoprotein carrier protein LolA n=1 Tax=Pseudahrensia aquimaris TaxID=744461 RepID=A0ABW3FDQ9_9HYPH